MIDHHCYGNNKHAFVEADFSSLYDWTPQVYSYVREAGITKSSPADERQVYRRSEVVDPWLPTTRLLYSCSSVSI